MSVTPEALADALRTRPPIELPALPGRRNHLRAGVLVPLRWTDDRIEALTTLRPRTLRRHGGEVSFPGGRREPGDVDLLHTALRETHEELGLARLTVLGRLASMPIYTSDFRLEPFVAQVDAHEAIVPDPVEVEAVLALDLMGILRRGQVESMRATHGTQRYEMPIFRPGGHVMFGATAMSLLELLSVLAEVSGLGMPEMVPGGLTWEALREHAAHAGRASA